MKFVNALIILVLLPTATALYGGETWTYHFPECNALDINITGTLPIDDGEYIIISNCTGNNNSYTCACSDDYNFSISFKTNTLNNYTFSFNYDYDEVVIVPTSTGDGGGGGGGYTSSWICGNWSECINSWTNRTCWKGMNKNINYTQSKRCIMPAKETKEKEVVKVVEKEIEEEINITENVTLPKKNDTKIVKLKPKESADWGFVIIPLTILIIGILCYFIVIYIKRKSESD